MDVFGPAFKMIELMFWFFIIVIVGLLGLLFTIGSGRKTKEDEDERKRIEEIREYFRVLEERAKKEGKTVDQILDEMRNKIREENKGNH